MEHPAFDDDLDAIDAQDIEAMQATRGWKLYAARLAACLEDARMLVEHAAIENHPRLVHHLGRVQAFRAAAGIPALLIEEARENAQRRSRRG